MKIIQCDCSRFIDICPSDNGKCPLCGTSIDKNNADINAVKYANDNERPVYSLIEKTENMIASLLMEELAKKELEDKINTNAKNMLFGYKQKLDFAEKTAHDNFAQLEKIEKSIYEQAIDCMVLVDECQYTLNSMHSSVMEIDSRNKTEISYDVKMLWEVELDAIRSASNMEISKLKRLESSNELFSELKKLQDLQDNQIDVINKNIYDINKLKSEIQSLVSDIEAITQKYEKAREDIEDGNYNKAEELITQVRFDEIIEQAMAKNQIKATLLSKKT